MRESGPEVEIGYEITLHCFIYMDPQGTIGGVAEKEVILSSVCQIT